MTQATTTTSDPGSSTSTNGSKPKAEKTPPSPIEAITKITKILDQLSASDRKRVLAFVNESADEPKES